MAGVTGGNRKDVSQQEEHMVLTLSSGRNVLLQTYGELLKDCPHPCLKVSIHIASDSEITLMFNTT